MIKANVAQYTYPVEFSQRYLKVRILDRSALSQVKLLLHHEQENWAVGEICRVPDEDLCIARHTRAYIH